jgi:sugar O-acyltransferase (sialic acid O-acetyltransferase NeuD family)
MAKVIIFGLGDIAQIANYYLNTDSEHEIAAFTVDRDYMTQSALERKPVIAFDEIEKTFPPSECKMFIALSYAQMNKLREGKYHEAKRKGYELISYVSSNCSWLSQFECGDNCFVFEDNTIQPFVRIGNNVTLWSGNHIGHHSIIHDHNFVSSHVVISGHCIVESNCFLGVNAAIGHNVRIARRTLLGVGVNVSKDTEEGGVYVAPRPVKLDKSSDQIKL